MIEKRLRLDFASKLIDILVDEGFVFTKNIDEFKKISCQLQNPQASFPIKD